MIHKKVISLKSFLLSGGAFVALNFLGNLFELGFNGVLVRLPEGGYATVGVLFKMFFLIAAPLASIQLVVGKEISALTALDRYGEARYFAVLALRYVIVTAFAVMLVGLAFSPLIARFLRIGMTLPVTFTMLAIVLYSPIPVLFGIIQGMKKFLTLGLMNISWSGNRFFLSLAALVLFSAGVNGIMITAVIAALLTIIVGYIPLRSLLRHAPVEVSRPEIRRAFAFAVPIAVMLYCVTFMRGVDVFVSTRYFTVVAKNAYMLASMVGSAFFTLSGIFMVMYPTVSHETTLNRNPIRFLFRSMLFTCSLSLAGIAFAWFFPGLVTMIFAFGKEMPGAEPLVRIVGIMVLPLSLVYLITNYFLAQHIAGFLPILIGGSVFEAALVFLMHGSPLQLLGAVGISNSLTLAGMLMYLWKKHRYYGQV